MMKTSEAGNLAGAALGASLPKQLETARARPLLAPDSIAELVARFEKSAQVDEDGIEYWQARELQKLLGYADYRNFLGIVQKAMESCRVAEQVVENHFVEVNEMVEIGSKAAREISDFRLTRYACYLIAQNGDARKKPVACAQTYFAIQTRRQEIQDEDMQQYAPLSEDHKCVLLRDELKTHNKHLASAAKEAGVVAPLDFVIFQTFGYKGLYGGLDRAGIQRRKGLKSKDNILDRMGSTELAANLFRATQTEEKLRRENTQGKGQANELHFQVGRRVRINGNKDCGPGCPQFYSAGTCLLLCERKRQTHAGLICITQKTGRFERPNPFVRTVAYRGDPGLTCRCRWSISIT